MDSSWISSTKDNVFNYFYYHITSEDNRKIVETNAKEKRETDILVNKHDVIEATHSIRVMADMYKREKELEEKVASLKLQCNEKNKEICILQDKIAELQKNEKERDADFENTLESKEQLLLKAKKVASVFKRKLLRNEEETKDLNNQLISMKARETQLAEINASLQHRLGELQEKIEGITSKQLKQEQVNRQKERQLLIEINSLRDKLSAKNAALLERENSKNHLLETFREFKQVNASLIRLDQQLADTQRKFTEVVRESQERENVHQKNKDLQKQQIALSTKQLSSSKAAMLQELSQAKAEVIASMESSPAENSELPNFNISFESKLQDLQKQLSESQEAALSERIKFDRELKLSKECELRLYELNFSLETRLKEAQQQLKQTMNQLNQQREFLAELKIQSPPLEHVIRMDKRHENYQEDIYNKLPTSSTEFSSPEVSLKHALHYNIPAARAQQVPSIPATALVNPYSMKAIHRTKEGSIKLRPMAPCIPVISAPIPATQTNKIDQSNPSTGNQGFFRSLLGKCLGL